MMKLDDRLTAITHMMDHADAYGPDEVRTWQVLTRHIDRACFEHTGKLIVTKLPLDVIAAHTARPKDAVVEALEQLMQRGHITIEPHDDGYLRYQLFLFQTTQPVDPTLLPSSQGN